MILPEHLAEFEDSSFQRENHELFAPYLLSAYRYHALAVRGRRDTRGTASILCWGDSWRRRVKQIMRPAGDLAGKVFDRTEFTKLLSDL